MQQDQPYRHQNYVRIGLGIFAVLQILIILSYHGTVDAGDSVLHYLFAHHAPEHPENLLDHWAKPVFTLLSTPFAIWGFAGMKVFNCLLGLLAAWYLYKSAVLLRFERPWLAPILLFACPDWFVAQFSGYTEPLFAAFLVIGIYSFLREKWLLVAVLLSFLPFVRTEGFLLMPVFALWLILHNRWKTVPFLGTGLIIYSIAGAFHYGNLLWIFTENPYQSTLQNYGSGTLWHFPSHLINILGIPVLALFVLGWIFTWLKVRPIRLEKPHMSRDRMMIGLLFIVYFGAHAWMWWTSTGHSMGLTRVMIAIVPLAVLIALEGFDGLMRLIPAHKYGLQLAVSTLLIAYILIFPVSGNNASLHFKKDLGLDIDQRLLVEVCDWMQKQGMQDRKLFYDHPSLAWQLNNDFFDPAKHESTLQVLKKGLPEGTVMVWDSWFARKEGGMQEAWLDQHKAEWEMKKSFSAQEGNVLFEFRIYLPR